LYEGVEYIDSLPEDAQVKVINENLKQELNGTLPAVGYKEESAYWDYNFTFPITLSGYDADSYMLGQTEISNRSPLIDHAKLFLSYLNLPSQYYESKDGEMIRNATAHGRKYVKNIRGIYGGDVTFPSIEANIYHGTYIDAEAENQTEQIIYKKEVTATYKRDGRKGLWNFLSWLLTKSVTLSILSILLIILLLLVMVKRKRKRNRVRKGNLQKKMDERTDVHSY